LTTVENNIKNKQQVNWTTYFHKTMPV